MFLLFAVPHMLLVALMFYGIDMFFINILTFCVGYMKFVQCEFKRLKKDIENGLKCNKVIGERVKDIVIAHTSAIKFSEKLEEVLNFLMLVLYSVNTVVICFLFFEFQIVSFGKILRSSVDFTICFHQLLSDTINFLKVLVFFGVVQTLLLLFSYFGTKLMEEVRHFHLQFKLFWD
jgi:hypothetical protein